MENKTISIALSSILIYLISNKIHYILSQIFLWLGIEFTITNKFILIILSLIITTISLFAFIGLYNRVLRNKVPSVKTILILIAITILSFLLIGLSNYLLGKYSAQITLSHSEYLSVYMGIYSLSNLFAFIHHLLILGFFLWKLFPNKKAIQ